VARSLEAYVVPQVLDVVTRAPGFVSTILVREHDLVVRGQPLVDVERRWEAWPQWSDHEALECVKAPTSGRIVRCWVAVGNAVGPMRPIVSIASCEDVLVVARFARGTGSCLRSARLASVLIDGSSAKATPAKIVSVVEVPDGGDEEDPELASGAIRVVLQLGSAPDEALWPGIPVLVEV
jgi:multidrug resistance efflux pump